VRLARNGLALADQVGLTAAGIAKGFNLPDPSEHFFDHNCRSGFCLHGKGNIAGRDGVIAGATLLAGLVQLVSDFGLNTSIHGKMDFDQALLIRG